MDVTIIGAGNVGSALATSFARAGHSVTLTSRDPEHASGVARTVGAQVGGSNKDAVTRADIVVLAVPFASAPEIAAEIRDAVTGKVVVDATNRLAFGPNGPDIDATSSNAEELAAMLPGAHVVKAFNTLLASHQADPIADGVRLDGFVAGDDPDAKATVLDLVASIGLDPVDVGPLVRARQLEGLAFLNISLNIANDGMWVSGWKLVGAPTVGSVAA